MGLCAMCGRPVVVTIVVLEDGAVCHEACRTLPRPVRPSAREATGRRESPGKDGHARKPTRGSRGSSTP